MRLMKISIHYVPLEQGEPKTLTLRVSAAGLLPASHHIQHYHMNTATTLYYPAPQKNRGALHSTTYAYQPTYGHCTTQWCKPSFTATECQT